MMMQYSLLVCLIVFTCSASASVYYFNAESNCPPPIGCDFLNNSTWINGTAPTGEETDIVYIISSSPNNTLVVANHLFNPRDPSYMFNFQLLIVQGATLVIDFSSVIADQLQISNGTLIIRNGTSAYFDTLTSNFSHIYSMQDSFTSMEELHIDSLSSFTLHDFSVSYWTKAFIHGAVYVPEAGNLHITQLDLWGSLTGSSSLFIGVVNAHFWNHISIPKFSGYSIVIGPGVVFTVTSSIMIMSNITLSSGSELQITNVWSAFGPSLIRQVVATGPCNITVQSSYVVIGANLTSDLSLVTLSAEGTSTIGLSAVQLGNVISKDFQGTAAFSTLLIQGPVILSRDIDFRGQIQSTSNFTINSDLLSISGCLTNYDGGLLNSYGTIVCSSPDHPFNSSSWAVTNIYGNLEAYKVITENAAQLNVYGVIEADEQVYVDNAQFNLYGSVETGAVAFVNSSHLHVQGDIEASEMVFSRSEISSSDGGSIDIPLIVFTDSQLNVIPNNSLSFSGNVSLLNSIISVRIFNDTDHNDDENSFILNIDGSVDVSTAKLQVNAAKGDAPKTETDYNLLNSSLPIIGSLESLSLTLGSVEVKSSRETQITFTYKPPKKDLLPLWAIIAIGAGGGALLLLIVIVIVLVKTKSKRHKYKDLPSGR